MSSKPDVSKDKSETIREKFARLVDDGDLIGIYENHCLGDPNVGRRIAFVYHGPVLAFAKVGETRAHDGEHGLGWRYVLITITGDIDYAARVLEGVDNPSDTRVGSAPTISSTCEETKNDHQDS